MEASTPPLLRLNYDCLLHVAEAVAILDFDLWTERLDHLKNPCSPSVLMALNKPRPLIAFSMINKEIREKTSLIVFRNVFLCLDLLYPREFRCGGGIMELNAGTARYERTIRWPRDLIVHAKSLSLECISYHTSADDLDVNARQEVLPPLVPPTLLDLLRTPRMLKRLCISELPMRLLKDIKIYARYLRLEPLQQVEELVVSFGAEYFMRICPNTRTLYLAETNCPTTTRWRAGWLHTLGEIHKEYKGPFYRYASALTKLRSLQIGVMCFALNLHKLHEHLSGLEHLYLEAVNTVRQEYSLEGLSRIVQGFDKLRTLTVDVCPISNVGGHAEEIREGMEIDDWPPLFLSEDFPGADSWLSRRAEVAEALLCGGHPALQAVELPADDDCCIYNNATTFRYSRFVKGAGKRKVDLERTVVRSSTKFLARHWHSADFQ
ncbi:uncharacterized protein BKCO1_6400011 [Diplodia corticola]|uniref:Uncharacterized protein n=1 Tax=Diplodia corticola TaxID=236234 RepID=A0A1J9RCM3_9PEZI|nr:uncharacterized protein BKCO1_6400011 [Diplodia corticola]OJD30235.1 hypothetical protein BKCO1_6400011 [Diplodia corticola]